MRTRMLGCAKRIYVETNMGEREEAWDCRPFGLGRIVSPAIPVDIELQPGTHLNLHSGELRRSATSIAA